MALRRQICLMAYLIVFLELANTPKLSADTPVPAGAKITLELDKQEYFLGENILLHFVVANVGQEPFSIKVGGDYRGAHRSLRFKITATDEKGQVVADPNPSTFNMGGISYGPLLKSGAKNYSSLPLYSYCRFEKPGVYQIQAVHDLGWKETPERKFPVGRITLKLMLPDAKQAAKVVEEMYAFPKNYGVSAGSKNTRYADFATLNHPVYLPILTPKAAQGDEQALRAIGSIPSTEATKALIELLSHKDAKFVRSVLQTLNERLPDPLLEGKLKSRNPFSNNWEEPRRYLVKNSWKPEFAPSIRKVAAKLLQEKDEGSLKCSGYILQCLGEIEDLPILIHGLDSAVIQAKGLALDTNSYPRPRGACMEMLRAATVMMELAIEPPQPSQSPGERILFALAIKNRPKFRPKGWESTYADLLQDEYPYVREIGLECMPESPDKSLVKLLPGLLLDANMDVQIAACKVTAKVKADELRKPLLKVLTTAKDDWLVRYASYAAKDFLPSLQIIQVFVNRLDDEEMSYLCQSHLTNILTGYSGSHGPKKLTAAQAKACKKVWLRFIQEHEKELSNGQRFAINDPVLPVTELFPGTEFYGTKRK
jgi:hypothetical protein